MKALHSVCARLEFSHKVSRQFRLTRHAIFFAAKMTAQHTTYIVVFKNGTSKTVIEQVMASIESAGGSIGHRYDSALLGFSAQVPTAMLRTLESHPHVDFVEQDQVVHIANNQ